jgi:hypothetical protein
MVILCGVPQGQGQEVLLACRLSQLLQEEQRTTRSGPGRNSAAISACWKGP